MIEQIKSLGSSLTIEDNEYFSNNLKKLREMLDEPYLNKRFKEVDNNVSLEDEFQNLIEEISKKENYLREVIDFSIQLYEKALILQNSQNTIQNENSNLINQIIDQQNIISEKDKKIEEFENILKELEERNSNLALRYAKSLDIGVDHNSSNSKLDSKGNNSSNSNLKGSKKNDIIEQKNLCESRKKVVLEKMDMQDKKISMLQQELEDDSKIIQDYSEQITAYKIKCVQFQNKILALTNEIRFVSENHNINPMDQMNVEKTRNANHQVTRSKSFISESPLNNQNKNYYEAKIQLNEFQYNNDSLNQKESNDKLIQETKNYFPLSIDIPMNEKGSIIGELTPENNPLFGYPLSGHSETYSHLSKAQDNSLMNKDLSNAKSNIKMRDFETTKEIHLIKTNEEKDFSTLSDRDQNEIHKNSEVSIFNNTTAQKNESKKVIVEEIEAKFDDDNKKEMEFQLMSDHSINIFPCIEKNDMEIQCLIDYSSIHRKAISTITTTSTTSNIPSPREFAEFPVYNEINPIRRKGTQENIRKLVNLKSISLLRVVESPLLYFVDKKYEEWLKGNQFKKEQWKIAEKEYFFMLTLAIQMNYPDIEKICQVNIIDLYNEACEAGKKFHMFYHFVESKLNKIYLRKLFEVKSAGKQKVGYNTKKNAEMISHEFTSNFEINFDHFE